MSWKDFHITCAQCDRPVAEMTVWRDEANQALIFKVACHGERDQCEIDEASFFNGQLTEAAAFKTKLLAV